MEPELQCNEVPAMGIFGRRAWQQERKQVGLPGKDRNFGLCSKGNGGLVEGFVQGDGITSFIF